MVDTTLPMNDQDAESESRRPGGSGDKGLLGLMQRLLRDAGLGGRAGVPDDGAESIADIVRAQGASERPVSEAERFMLLNLLKFRSVRVEDVMVPRADIIAVDVETPLSELLLTFKTASHSRLPVYRETLDNPVGMVHIKDLMACFAADADEEVGSQSETPCDTDMDDAAGPVSCIDPPPSLSRLKRDVLFVPPSMPAVDLLLQMQTERMHMALVIDEYGGTDGLVTIEDLVEMIVGDIEDEHDTEEDVDCVALEGGGYEADARMEIDDFQDATGLDIRLHDGDDEEVDTLGGLVFTLAGRVPRRGEIIKHPGGFDLEIAEADPRRIRRLKVLVTGRRAVSGGGPS